MDTNNAIIAVDSIKALLKNVKWAGQQICASSRKEIPYNKLFAFLHLIYHIHNRFFKRLVFHT